MQSKKTKLFSTQPRRADDAVWNEIYQINVVDSENESLVVAVNEVGLIKSQLVGEIVFPLHPNERTFDHPDYEYLWFPLKNSSGVKSGELKLYVEFFDVDVEYG